MDPLKSFAVAFLAVMAIGCGTAPEVSQPAEYLNQIYCSITQFEPIGVTKVTSVQSGTGVVSTWEEGDIIGVFPDKGGDQVSFTVADGAGTANCTFDGHGWGLLTSARYSAY